MAIAVGDRSRAVAWSHVQSGEHTASGVAPSPLAFEQLHLMAARCEPPSAHRASCLCGCGWSVFRLLDAIRRYRAVVDAAAEADWNDARDASGKPIDLRVSRSPGTDLVRVELAARYFHQHQTSGRQLTRAVTSRRSLAEGAR